MLASTVRMVSQVPLCSIVYLAIHNFERLFDLHGTAACLNLELFDTIIRTIWSLHVIGHCRSKAEASAVPLQIRLLSLPCIYKTLTAMMEWRHLS
jgi:hypothetical protein